MTITEHQIERDLIAKLGDLKYTYRPDIRDRAALEANFRAKFEAQSSSASPDSQQPHPHAIAADKSKASSGAFVRAYRARRRR